MNVAAATLLLPAVIAAAVRSTVFGAHTGAGSVITKSGAAKIVAVPVPVIFAATAAQFASLKAVT